MEKITATILFIIELVILIYLFSRIWIMLKNYDKKERKRLEQQTLKEAIQR